MALRPATSAFNPTEDSLASIVNLSVSALNVGRLIWTLGRKATTAVYASPPKGDQ